MDGKDKREIGEATVPVAGVSAYDSRIDTWKHIERVRDLLRTASLNIQARSDLHDRSKLSEPELAVFNEYTPKLKDATYGSDEYKSFLRGMKPALDHHYASNSHHPEHYDNGIRGMSLLDLVEMLCDWKAATERHTDGDLAYSLVVNQDRFGYSDELRQILENTARELAFTTGGSAASPKRLPKNSSGEGEG